MRFLYWFGLSVCVLGVLAVLGSLIGMAIAAGQAADDESVYDQTVPRTVADLRRRRTDLTR